MIPIAHHGSDFRVRIPFFEFIICLSPHAKLTKVHIFNRLLKQDHIQCRLSRHPCPVLRSPETIRAGALNRRFHSRADWRVSIRIYGVPRLRIEKPREGGRYASSLRGYSGATDNGQRKPDCPPVPRPPRRGEVRPLFQVGGVPDYFTSLFLTTK